VNWLAWLRRGKPALSAAQGAALRRWRELPEPGSDASLARERAVVVDVESSGLDPLRDRLISVGAVGVRAGLARHDDAFEVVLRQEKASADANIVVHGIGGAAQLAGREPVDGLLDFLAFAGKAPLVAFHADFDRVLIERASAAALGMKPANRWLDLALLAPALYPDQPESSRALDDWLRRFGIENYERHNALADALATAQLLLVALAEAGRQGVTTWARLARLQEGQRWLARARRTF
jgi:DNA polymerase III subunit epsilon